MRSLRLFLIGLLTAVVVACGTPQAVQPSTTPAAAVAVAGTALASTTVTPTSTPVVPTLVPTSTRPATSAPATTVPSPAIPATQTIAPTVSPTAPPTATVAPPVAGAGKIVLSLPAGIGTGQVGIGGTDGPASFRIGADGSIRILDTHNQRLLFFDGATGKPQRTISLSETEHPTDFAVKGTGELFVLDTMANKFYLYDLDGRKRKEFKIPLAPEHTEVLKTLSLTASGDLWIMNEIKAFPLLTPDGKQLSRDATEAAGMGGSVTVRSNARFRIEAGGDKAHLIVDVQSQPAFDQQVGLLDEHPVFLDVNQGMELYVAAKKGESTEIRRYSPAGELMGTLSVDRNGCRPTARGIYVDRPGDVYTMCTGAGGVTVARYSMTDLVGKPLPRYNKLVTTVVWSPNSLQAAPG